MISRPHSSQLARHKKKKKEEKSSIRSWIERGQSKLASSGAGQPSSATALVTIITTTINVTITLLLSSSLTPDYLCTSTTLITTVTIKRLAPLLPLSPPISPVLVTFSHHYCNHHHHHHDHDNAISIYTLLVSTDYNHQFRYHTSHHNYQYHRYYTQH